nr:hypothetical protein [Tanacetum cinerariifolium]
MTQPAILTILVKNRTTYSANSLLEEFADALALITYPSDYDDNLTCDIESDINEIEFLLYQGEDSDFKDSIDQSVLANCDDLFVDPTLKMFTDEQPLDYSFPSRFDVDDVLPSPDNEDKDSDPPFHELLVFIEVPNSMRLLPFSSENEEKVFKPGINTFKKPDGDFSCSKWKEYSSLGCSSVPFLSPLIRSSMGECGPAHLTLNKRFVGGTPCLSL